MLRFSKLLMFYVLALGTMHACQRSEPREPATFAANLAVRSPPILSIGQEGRAEYEFSDIVGLGRFSAGHWVVVDGASRELRFFDAGGTFLRRVGGRGAGPEEFSEVAYGAVSSADKLHVYDARLRRVSVWSDEGELVQTSTLQIPTEGGTVPRVVGLAGDGVAIWSSYNVPPCIVDQVSTDTVAYYSLDLSAARDRNLRPLIRAAGGKRWGNTINVLRACLRNPIPFSRATLAFAGQGHLYLVSSDASLIGVNVTTGAEVRRTVPVSPRALEQSVIDGYIADETAREAVDENGAPLALGMAEYAQRLRVTPYPDSLPHFDQGIVDTEGWIWLRPYQLSTDSVASWLVLPPESEQPQTVDLPTAFRPLEIGREYVAGVLINDLGVETISVFGLSRHGVASVP